MFISLIFLLLSSSYITNASKPPNILLILTDDQDLKLNSLSVMTRTNQLIAEKGVTFTNAFVSTPICCPSRASLLTGLYLHNHGTVNNSVSGGCNSKSWRRHHEKHTIATYLHNIGYRTFYAGKYLNQYGQHGNLKVPPGWDSWAGLVGNSKYYDYVLSVNGTAQHHAHDYNKDYLTDVIKRFALDFLVETKNSPFLMVVAPPASHAPFLPAPQYQGKFSQSQAPRTPNFNIPSLDKHWLVRQGPAKLSDKTQLYLDDIYQRRLETLLSVDDMVAELFSKLEQVGAINDTIVIFTSDHGFHLGQFGLPWDKRTPYEEDLRVPLLIRGPGILKNSIVSSPVVNIDILPSILNMAAIHIPNHLDGLSFLPLIQDNTSLSRTERSFLVEYRGEGSSHSSSTDCSSSLDPGVAICVPEAECKCEDAVNNTYNCIRHLSPKCNLLFCQFADSQNFVELYDLTSDPYELQNLAANPDIKLKHLIKGLKHLSSCKDHSCSVKLNNICF